MHWQKGLNPLWNLYTESVSHFLRNKILRIVIHAPSRYSLFIINYSLFIIHWFTVPQNASKSVPPRVSENISDSCHIPVPTVPLSAEYNVESIVLGCASPSVCYFRESTASPARFSDRYATWKFVLLPWFIDLIFLEVTEFLSDMQIKPTQIHPMSAFCHIRRSPKNVRMFHATRADVFPGTSVRPTRHVRSFFIVISYR